MNLSQQELEGELLKRFFEPLVSEGGVPARMVPLGAAKGFRVIVHGLADPRANGQHFSLRPGRLLGWFASFVFAGIMIGWVGKAV